MPKPTQLFTKPALGKLSPTRKSPPVRDLTRDKLQALGREIEWREALRGSRRAVT